MKSRPKHYQEKYQDNQKNEVVSLDSHPDGYLTIGAEMGEIMIWDKIHGLKQSYHPHQPLVVWQEHTKNCHFLKWNADGTVLLSASNDGTTKLWSWDRDNISRNKAGRVIKSFGPLQVKGYETIALVASWSCRCKFIYTSFCQYNRRKQWHEDENSINCIYVYSCQQGEVIRILDRESTPLKFSDSIIIIDSHPNYEHIAMTASYKGIIILWDIEQGVILNKFTEKGFAINYPQFECTLVDGNRRREAFPARAARAYCASVRVLVLARLCSRACVRVLVFACLCSRASVRARPLAEPEFAPAPAPDQIGKFSPDGLQFSVSSHFGTLSVYGVGNSDFYLSAPPEQFFANDNGLITLDDQYRVISLDQTNYETEVHEIDRGQICNMQKQPYTFKFQNNLLSLWNRGYFAETFQLYDPAIDKRNIDRLQLLQRQDAAFFEMWAQRIEDSRRRDDIKNQYLKIELCDKSILLNQMGNAIRRNVQQILDRLGIEFKVQMKAVGEKDTAAIENSLQDYTNTSLQNYSQSQPLQQQQTL